MAPIQDSSFTNPDSLRLLYLNPRNPLRDLDMDETSVASPTTPVAQPTTSVPGSGGGGGTPVGCPAFGQWLLERVPHTRAGIRFLLVEDLLKGHPAFLWNPILRTFRRVIAAVLIENVECVQYRTFAGAESIVSYTHPVIQSLIDRHGSQICDLINEPDKSHAAVSYIDYALIETQIESISAVGKRNAVKISLEGDDGDIYCCGTDPLKTNLGHNNKPGGGGVIVE